MLWHQAAIHHRQKCYYFYSLVVADCLLVEKRGEGGPSLIATLGPLE